VLAVAVFVSNLLAWEGIPTLESVTSYRVSTAVLCAVTVAIAIVALVVRSHPRWPWFIVISGSAVQAAEAAVPTSEVEGNWGYIPEIVAMAGSTLVYLAAIGVFLATFAHSDSKG